MRGNAYWRSDSHRRAQGHDRATQQGNSSDIATRGRDRRSYSFTDCSSTRTSGARSSSSSRRDFRCVALDLPLGSHELPMPRDADLSPGGRRGA